ncbi:MAG: hypothetical protein MHM6MM_005424 [Cercozoa sp. M6MM]
MSSKKSTMKGMFKTIRRRFSSSKSSNEDSQSTPRKERREDRRRARTVSSTGAVASASSASSGNHASAVSQPAVQTPTRAKQPSQPAQSPSNVRMPAKLDKKELLEPMPSFRDCLAQDRQALLIRKLRLCCILFDFNDESTKENLGKEMKRQLLLELVDHVSTTKNWFSEATCEAIIEMVWRNLFRTLPPQSAVFDPDEDEPVLDPAWPHLQIVYEFLLRFVVSAETDTKVLKRYINAPFVMEILKLFDSEDPRERDYLKTILHRIYGKFMSLRSFMRRAINHVFYKFIYESSRHNGVGELLEILGSIINGFALPLKNEHKRFLRNVLLPLHKVSTLRQFHQQLSYCVTQFIDKEPKLAPLVITGLLRYWPVTSSSKEVLFLNECEEVLELTQTEEFRRICQPLFRQLARCISSPHFQVAERALFLWNNEYITSLTLDFRDQIMPIVFPALHENSKNHWNSTVHSLNYNIVKMFMDMDNELFDRCSRDHAAQEEAQRALRVRIVQRWNAIEHAAGQASESSTRPVFLLRRTCDDFGKYAPDFSRKKRPQVKPHRMVDDGEDSPTPTPK